MTRLRDDLLGTLPQIRTNILTSPPSHRRRGVRRNRYPVPVRGVASSTAVHLALLQSPGATGRARYRQYLIWGKRAALHGSIIHSQLVEKSPILNTGPVTHSPPYP